MEELKSLVERVRRGDVDAFDAVVRRFQDMAVGYAYSLLGDFHLAEDAAQEAFIRAFADLQSLRDPEAFAGWFRRIVFMRCSVFKRSRVPMTSLEDAVVVPSGEKGPDTRLEAKELKDRVDCAIHSLPELERSVITLFYINQFSQKEIAAFLEVPVTTVNNRLHTSRKRMKKELRTMAKQYLQGERPSKDERFVSEVNIVASQFDVGELVSACSDTVSHLIHDGVALKQDVGDIGEANTDKARVRQMVINILSNAIKFTDTGSVTVRTERVSGGGESGREDLVISVSDTGIGIPADELPTIFVPRYCRPEGSESRAQEGDRLGLAITKKLAELLGGSIGVETEVGKGSTFTVRVPLEYQGPA